MNITKNIKSLYPYPIAGAAALALTLTAGSALAVNAGPDNTKKDASNNRQSMNAQDATSWLSLVRSDHIIGTEVIGTSDEQIGSISDLVIDRGTGKVVFAIIGHGGVLTIGQDLFATEYNRLRYSPTEEQFSIQMTKEQADRQIEFLPENWKDLGRSGWMDGFSDLMTDSDTERYGDAKVVSGKVTKVNGTVTKVTRDGDGDNEDVVVFVDDEDGNSREVVLGPSWYIMGMDTSPSVNDRVEFSTVKHNGRMIATKARVADRDIKLRDSNGTVQWKVNNRNTPRYVLLSDLTGRSIEIGGTTGGEIQNTIVEANSGRVAFFGFDPNENFLGLGDEISLVPWSALQIGSDLTVWTDSGEQVFGRAMAMPDDLSTLRSRNSVANAYSPFGLQAPTFEKSSRDRGDMHTRMNDRDRSADYANRNDRDGYDRDRDDRMGHADRSGESWNKDSKLVNSFSKGKRVRVQGEFVGMDTVMLQNGSVEATSLWVKNDDGKQQVILGPNWYVDHQELGLKKGDSITIDGRSAKIDGKEYIAAWNINSSKNTWAFWNDTTPAWAD